MSLVQITKHQGVIKRVKAGERPLLETHLEDNQRAIGVTIEKVPVYGHAIERKTVDWQYTLYVETRL